MSNSSMFIDCECPKCGKLAGNNGHGDICRCSCGWQSEGISEHDRKLIEETIASLRNVSKT